MFVNLDYNKKPQEIKLYLAQPHMRVIASLSEAFNETLSIKLGEISELEFTLPYMITDEYTGKNIVNPNIEKARERMLVRVDMGGTFGNGGTYSEWFLIDSIEENGSDKTFYNVKALGLGQELAGKYIGEYEIESMNAKEMMETFLEGTVWNVGTVDPIFLEMYRSFESSSDSNALENITEMASTFGGLLEYNTSKRQVSLLDIRKNGTYKGFSVDYGKFINDISKTRTTDELVTRMYVFGEDDISISNFNPTGELYLENFDFYIYPFKRDANRNVIQSSYYMSDELCHALLDHKELVNSVANGMKNLSEDYNVLYKKKLNLEIELNELNLQKNTIEQLLDTAKSTEDTTLTTQREKELLEKQVQIDAKQAEIDSATATLTTYENSMNAIKNNISFQNNFTPEMLIELDPYIITKVWRDDRYFNEEELYNDGVKEFEKLREPKIVFTISIESLLDVIEEQYYWDKIILGDIIKVRYPQMNIEYEAKIIELNYDFNENKVELVVANTADFLDENEKLMQLIYDSSTATETVKNNKYKWDKVKDLSTDLESLFTEEWDATKHRITAGVANTVEIGNRGIIVRDPNFPNQVIIIQSGVIALSEDNGQTWKTAIKPTGIIAERIIGRLIAGAGLLITNEKGTFRVDDEGIFMNADKLVLSSGSQINDYYYWWDNYSEALKAYTTDAKLDGYERKVISNMFNKMVKNELIFLTVLSTYGEDRHQVILNEYIDAYDDLDSYLSLETNGVAIRPKESDKTQTVNIDTQLLRLKFENLKEKLDTVLKASSEILFTKKNIVNENATSVSVKELASMVDRTRYTIDLVKTNGNIFKGTITELSLRVVVKYYNGTTETDITSTLPPESFLWYKLKSDGTEDVEWSNSKVGIGSTLILKSTDVFDLETISCEVEIDV